jgi:hypothetical protein
MLAFQDPDITSNTQHCCGTLRVLHTAIKRKQLSMLKKGIVMLYDNTHAHTVLHALEGVGLFLTQPGPVTM